MDGVFANGMGERMEDSLPLSHTSMGEWMEDLTILVTGCGN